MKVVCESCQAKYQVPDERVAGKKLKIRCKRCGATVLIRGDLAQAAAASGVDSIPPASIPPIHVSEAPPTLEWHVSRDGDTRGPFETEELRAWLSSEPGGWEVHVWRESFPDWIEARACAELGPPLLAPSEVPGPVFDPHHEDEGPTQTFDAAALTAAPLMAHAAASRRAAQAADSARSSSIRTRSPSGISTGAAARVTSSEALTGERHEDSVLFSARAAHTFSNSAPAYTPGPNPGFAGGEGSGLIDIRALASLARQTSPRIAPGAVAAATAAAAAAQSGGYPVPDDGLSYGSEDDEALGALRNGNGGAFGRLDSLAPVSTGQQTSNVAVPLAILGGCALVAAAIFAAILIARPSHPPEAVAVTVPSVGQADSLAAAAQPPANAPEPEARPSEPPPAAVAEEPQANKEAASALADERADELASGKAKRQPRLPRTAAEDKKTTAPEEKAKPKKEEKELPPSLDDVMLADKARPHSTAPAPTAPAPTPAPEAAKPSNGPATDIDQLLAAKPAKQPAKSRSIDDLLDGAAVDKSPAPKPAAATAAAVPAAAAEDSDLPDSPSRDEILAAMRGVEAAVRACAEGQQVQGTAEVQLTITGNNGRVTTANVGGITGTVGSCIARAVRNAKFPRFTKPTFSVKYPYRF
jgi:predicted Zn finger-like uncharacterized protein